MLVCRHEYVASERCEARKKTKVRSGINALPWCHREPVKKQKKNSGRAITSFLGIGADGRVPCECVDVMCIEVITVLKTLTQ